MDLGEVKQKGYIFPMIYNLYLKIQGRTRSRSLIIRKNSQHFLQPKKKTQNKKEICKVEGSSNGDYKIIYMQKGDFLIF